MEAVPLQVELAGNTRLALFILLAAVSFVLLISCANAAHLMLARGAARGREMAVRIGLDYVAIDCAETKDGALLIFEADNTAIVHDMDPPSVYPYKPAQMQKIFNAFRAMLYRRAGRLEIAA